MSLIAADCVNDNKSLLSGAINDSQRKHVMDGLGKAASSYRKAIYDASFSGKKVTLDKEDLLDFVAVSIAFLEHSIDRNKREDGLYHAYNLMTIKNKEEVQISFLPEMLEGQVAILSSGYLSTQESVEVLDSLKASKLFREDQYSYILYPNKDLSRFVDKNTIPSELVQNSELLLTLVSDGNKSVLNQDCHGEYHFNGEFNNVNSLKAALANLPKKYSKLVKKEAVQLYALFETVFNHKAFTGRSGTFFGYEGLGSIYWHMVSKLLLATYEVTQKALDEGSDDALTGRLYDHYFEINAGIGAHKSPSLYGAFPTDPYSHTPGGKGAQQPGMTGQVKEDIISRFGELGLRVIEGKLHFDIKILRPSEFLTQSENFDYVDINGESKTISLNENSLAFTYCQVPIVYQKSAKNGVDLYLTSGEIVSFDVPQLDLVHSQSLFSRTGAIEKIIVSTQNKN